MEYGMKKIRKYIYLYSMRNNLKNIENRMMECRDENDKMEDDERIMKKWKIE